MIIKNFLYNIIKSSLSRFNLAIVNKNLIYFDKNLTLSQFNLDRQNIIKNIKLNSLITTAGKKLGSFEDPYYYALKKSLPIIDKKTFIKSFVKKIKSKIKSSRSASEAMKFAKSKKLSLYPEWALVLPWENITIEENYNTYLEKFCSKRKKLKKFYEKCDQCDKEKIIYNDLAWKSHAEQFYKLYNSILKNGFNENNLVSVSMFKYKNLTRFSLKDDGNHRIRVAYAIGKKSVPLKISEIIDFKEIDKWKNVKNGLYSHKEAKKVFTNYFNYNGHGANV
jgi:hypothetical protein